VDGASRENKWSREKPGGMGVTEQHSEQVFEETGYDITLLVVNDKQHYCERKVAVGGTRKTLGLFFVPGVDDHFPFSQQCEGEIEAYSWFFVDDLAKLGAGLATISAGLSGGRVRLFQVRSSAFSYVHHIAAHS
jgi:hypothetical protein